MQRRCVLVALGMLGCGASPALNGAAAAAPARAISLEKSADSGHVDRVGPTDGALTPDGRNDLGFAIQTEGPIAALFLVAVDETGKPNGTYQADTLIGQAESPRELGTSTGGSTAGLGVFDGDKPLNTDQGALEGMADGPHRLLLYVSPSSALTSGTKVRVYLQRPDNTLVAGATVTN